MVNRKSSGVINMNNITYQLGKSRYINGMYVTEYLNGKPNNFWGLDDLTLFQEYNVESYRRAKDWLIRNHPELLI
jgi:hypothetical protein